MLRARLLRPRLAVLLLALVSIPAAARSANFVLRGRVYAHTTIAHSLYVGVNDNYVTVRGDGSTDLDCWIYGDDGRLVDSDTDNTDYCVLETPGIGVHRLVIKNYGEVYNDYVVATR